MRMKKFLAFTLASALLVTAVPFNADAATIQFVDETGKVVSQNGVSGNTVSWDGVAAYVDGQKVAAPEGYTWNTAAFGAVSGNQVVSVNGVKDSEEATIDSVTIAGAPSSALKVGDSVELTATVKDTDGIDVTDVSDITWVSDNKSVATVTDGTVTAIAEGTAKITVTATYKGESKSAEVPVKVEKDSDESGSVSNNDVVSANDVKISPKPESLKVDETAQLTAKVTGKNSKGETVEIENAEITWDSEDDDVATVDTKGLLTAKKEGTVKISVKAVSVNTVEDFFVLKVEAKETTPSETTTPGTTTPSETTTPGTTTPSETTTPSDTTPTTETEQTVKPVVKLNAKSVPLQIKKSTTAIVASGLVKGDSVKSWKSNNTKVATVKKNGKLGSKITAKKKTGSAKITVTTKLGATATVTVKVQKGAVKLKSIKVNKSSVSLKVKKKFTIAVTKNPVTASGTATYKSSNTKVATVSKKGVITAKKKGKATITVKVGKKSKKVKVTVK